MKQKILYVLHCYHNLAGTEEHTRTLAQGLSADFEIYLTFPEQGQVHLLSGGEIIASYPAEPPILPFTPYRQALTEEALEKVLKQVSPDLIHVQHVLNWPLSALQLLLETKKPVLMSFHDYYVATPVFTMIGAGDIQQGLSPQYCQRIFGRDVSAELAERQAMLAPRIEKLNCCIVPSQFLGQQLKQVFPRDYQVIEHGISPFSVHRTKFSDSALRFGYLGSLLPQKGWLTLFKAFPELRESFPQAHITFFGGGERIEKRDLEGISFHGAYAPADIPKIMGQIDVGVIPSIFAETFSLVLSEFWMAGIPVIVSDIGALGERVVDGLNGKKFIPGDSASLIQALRYFLEHDDWRSWTLPRPRLLEEMLQDYRALYQRFLA